MNLNILLSTTALLGVNLTVPKPYLYQDINSLIKANSSKIINKRTILVSQQQPNIVSTIRV